MNFHVGYSAYGTTWIGRFATEHYARGAAAIMAERYGNAWLWDNERKVHLGSWEWINETLMFTPA